MKLKSTTSVITKVALVLAAFAGMNAFAGTADMSKGPEKGGPVEGGPLFETVGATLEAGYDSRYYFRGLWFADNTVWTNLSLSIPLAEKLTLGVGALYTSTTDTPFQGVDPNTGDFNADGDFDYTELDLYASLTYDAGFAKFALVYTHYEFFDGFSGTNFGLPNAGGEFNITSTEEVGIVISSTIATVNVYAAYYYDFNIGGSYAEVGVDRPIEVTSWLSIVPSVKLGWGNDYYTLGRSSGLTHVLPAISAPIKLTSSATLTPYIATNFSLETRHLNNFTDTEMFGGVKLSVTF